MLSVNKARTDSGHESPYAKGKTCIAPNALPIEPHPTITEQTTRLLDEGAARPNEEP